MTDQYPHEYRHTNPQQNMSEQNPKAYKKDYASWLSGICPRNAGGLTLENQLM